MEKGTRQHSAHNKSFCSLLRNSVNQSQIFSIFFGSHPHRHHHRTPISAFPPSWLLRNDDLDPYYVQTTFAQRAPLTRRMMLHYEPVMKQPLPRPPRHPIMILRQTRRQTRRSVPIGRTVARERCRLNVDRICCLVHFRHENNCRI